MTIYLEVEFSSHEMLVFSDWSFFMHAWKQYDKRKYYEYIEKFIPVHGKEITYFIMGCDDENQARAVAIFYHKVKAHGLIRKYRLD